MTNYTEPQWIAEGLLPEGLVFLQGKAKSGKTILSQQLCLEVSSGFKALGHFDVATGSAIHVASHDQEDTWLSRLGKMESHYGVDRQLPSNLYMMFDAPDGIGEFYHIWDWLADTKRRIPDLRLVVIDPLIPRYVSDSYGGRQETLGKLRAIAKKEHLTVVIVTLGPKAVDGDIMAGGDAVITLRKKPGVGCEGDIIIHTRDEEFQHHLIFNPQTFITTAEAVAS